MADLSRCFIWWAHTDSNRGPKDYETVKSTFLVVSQRLPKKADLARYPKFKGLGVSPWFWSWPCMTFETVTKVVTKDAAYGGDHKQDSGEKASHGYRS